MVKVFFNIKGQLPMRKEMNNTVVNGMRIKWKDMVYINIQVVLFIQVNGKMVNKRVVEFMNFQMVLFMMANGKIIGCMEKDDSLM